MMDVDLILGISCNNINSLTCDQTSGYIAHASSGVLVVFDTDTNRQVKYFPVKRNRISAANFSSDGKYVVTGETGYRPAIRVWKIKDGKEVATLYGHEFGIKSVLFSPTMDEIVSVGLEHDNVVNVWSWPEKHRLATNKIVDVIRAVAFSACGNFFVTAGIRHLKFWYPRFALPSERNHLKHRVCPLYGRPGILGECKKQIFVDVVCGNGVSSLFVFAITKSDGLVILTSSNRRLKMHKKIENYNGTCVKAHDKVLFIGFNTGDIHIFNSITLMHLAVLPVPNFFSCMGLNGGTVFSMTFNPFRTVLTAVYENSSICIWDLKNPRNVQQKYVAVYHSQPITSFDVFASDGVKGRPSEMLVTVSHDATVRMWGLVMGNASSYDRLSILYTDDKGRQEDECQDSGPMTMTTVKVSPDQEYIAVGFKTGHVSVFDQHTYEQSVTFQVHSRDVTCLAFFMTHSDKCILVSGSRDRLIHVMDVKSDFRLVSTLNFHSSSITAISLFNNCDQACLISCAADRGICISRGTEDSLGLPKFHLAGCATCVSTPCDISWDHLNSMLILGCQDGNIRVLDIALLEEHRAFPGCVCDEAQVHKVCLDSDICLLLTAASDRSINVINYSNGEILHTAYGHTMCVTGLAFTSSDDHVISASMDGCIFLWKLSPSLLDKRKEIKSHRESNAVKIQTLTAKPSIAVRSTAFDFHLTKQAGSSVGLSENKWNVNAKSRLLLFPRYVDPVSSFDLNCKHLAFGDEVSKKHKTDTSTKKMAKKKIFFKTSGDTLPFLSQTAHKSKEVRSSPCEKGEATAARTSDTEAATAGASNKSDVIHCQPDRGLSRRVSQGFQSVCNVFNLKTRTKATAGIDSKTSPGIPDVPISKSHIIQKMIKRKQLCSRSPTIMNPSSSDKTASLSRSF